MGKSFLHDTCSRGDKKLLKLVRNFGEVAAFRWWCFLEMLREEEGLFWQGDIDAFAEDRNLSNEDAQELINAFLECDLLFVEDGFYQSESLNKRISRFNAKSKAGSESAAKRQQKLQRNHKLCSQQKTECVGNKANTHTTTIQSNSSLEEGEGRNLLPAQDVAFQILEEIGEIGREQATSIYMQNGLEASDLSEGARLIAGDYDSNPGKRRNPALHITKSWVIQEILKTKTEKTRLRVAEQRDSSRPPPKPTGPKIEVKLEWTKDEQGRAVVKRTVKPKEKEAA